MRHFITQDIQDQINRDGFTVQVSMMYGAAIHEVGIAVKYGAVSSAHCLLFYPIILQVEEPQDSSRHHLSVMCQM